MDVEECNSLVKENSKPFSFKDTFYASLSSIGLIALVIAIYSFLGMSNFANIGGEPVHGIKGFLVTILFGLLGSIVLTVFIWVGSKIHHLVLRALNA
mgnify:CR=1 FL=1